MSENRNSQQPSITGEFAGSPPSARAVYGQPQAKPKRGAGVFGWIVGLGAGAGAGFMAWTETNRQAAVTYLKENSERAYSLTTNDLPTMLFRFDGFKAMYAETANEPVKNAINALGGYLERIQKSRILRNDQETAALLNIALSDGSNPKWWQRIADRLSTHLDVMGEVKPNGGIPIITREITALLGGGYELIKEAVITTGEKAYQFAWDMRHSERQVQLFRTNLQEQTELGYEKIIDALGRQDAVEGLADGSVTLAPEVRNKNILIAAGTAVVVLATTLGVASYVRKRNAQRKEKENFQGKISFEREMQMMNPQQIGY